MHCIVYIMMLYDVDVVTFKVPHVTSSYPGWIKSPHVVTYYT